MLKMLLLLFLALLVVFAGVTGYGTHRWNAETQALRSQLETARMPVTPPTIDLKEIDGLPAPVQRFFRTVLKEGRPMVTGVRLRHSGTFNMGEHAEQWKPFTSEQQVVTRRPGFDWNGEVNMMPFLPVRVHDAYVAGEGILHAAVLGIFTVADLRGTSDVAEGELMRFFAEAAWYPTALLPSQNVRWEAVDAHSARATLVDGKTTLTMLFTFNDQGVIASVRADARGRTVGDKVIPTPWQGRFWNYQERDGMLVPLNGEVEWLLPEGPKPYWRGSVTEIAYEFAQ